MRLWTVHPKLLDTQGLLALWREALLAQEVLAGRTVGYRNHPQLERFKAHPRPDAAIAVYLLSVWKEARRRGYDFDRKKIASRRTGRKIPVTRGQLEYEFKWLCQKLKKRSPEQYRFISARKKIAHHPFFRSIKGSVAEWERV